MSSMSVRKPARPLTWLALVTLLSSFFVASGLDPQAAHASGKSIAITAPANIVVGQANALTIVPSGFVDTGSYQATVKLVDSSGQDTTNGTFAQTVSGLTAIEGFGVSTGAKIGFVGSLTNVTSALGTVTWTPSTEATGTRIAVTIATAPGANQFYSSSTGRYYEYVEPAGGISWTNARAAALTKTAFGLKGYLAHITSAAENEFIANETSASNIWIGATDSAVEGQWRWDGATITGESDIVFDTYNTTYATPISLASGYANWTLTVPPNAPRQLTRGAWADSEPNNSWPNQDCALTNWGTKGLWDDQDCDATLNGYLVEYGGRDDDSSATSTAVTINALRAVDVIAAPDAPTINSITAGNGSLTVAVTPGSNGGSAVTNFQYSTDGGANFVAFDPQVTSGPLTITTQSTAGRPALVNNTAYSVRIKAVNVAGASLQSGATSATPVASKPAAPVITSVTAGNQSLAVAFSISDNGGEEVTGVEYQLNGGSFTAFAGTTSPATITGLTNGTSYTVVIRATNSVGTSDNSASSTGTPVAPPAPASTPTVVTPTTTTPINGNTNGLPSSRGVLPTTPTTPLSGPLPSVNGNGQIPSAPNGSIGGRPATVTTTVVGGNQMTLQTGSSTFGVAVPTGQGQVNSGQNGDRELAVQAGAATRLSGSGLMPGSTVQVFMPLGANGSRELSQLQVGPTGAFDGDAVFTTRPTDPPLPIGRNLMQIASLNNAGERVIVEMAINIAQPSPQPGILRSTGTIASMAPGESFATRAGEPTDVVLTVDEQRATTTFEGDGWTFAVDMSGGSNQVTETQQGGAMISVVRGGEATISGNGFMPLTRADIWLFSDPTLLGSVEIDETGEFSGPVTIDGRVIPVGDHTLQLQGVGEDGFIVTANLGVVVSDGVPLAAATGTTGASTTLLWWVLAAFLLVASATLVGWRVTTRRRSSSLRNPARPLEVPASA